MATGPGLCEPGTHQETLFVSPEGQTAVCEKDEEKEGDGLACVDRAASSSRPVVWPGSSRRLVRETSQ